MAITETNLNGRILGVSRTAEVGTRTLFLSSGNNVGPVQDMTRRVLTIDLNPTEEIPATREYKNTRLLESILENRGKYVSMALTIISAWLQSKDCVSGCQMRNLSSFSQWSEWCRAPLIWLGREDPATRLFEIMKEDPEREQTGRMFMVLSQEFSSQNFTVKMIVMKSFYLNAESDLKDVLEELDLMQFGSLNRRRLGWWLKKHEGVVVNGLKLVVTHKSKNGVAYRLEKQVKHEIG